MENDETDLLRVGLRFDLFFQGQDWMYDSDDQRQALLRSKARLQKCTLA